MNMKPRRRRLNIGATDGRASGRPKQPARALYGRSPELNSRIAIHEGAGHAFVGRCMGTEISSVSIVPGDGFEGRCLSKAYQASFYEMPEDKTIEIVDLCERAQRLMPELGINRIEAAEFFQRATTFCVELVAGTVAETILHPQEPPLPASHDQIEAAAFASIAVASPRAVHAFLEYCKAEAAALILDHLGAAKAIADALVEHGELSGAEVDDIIAVALAREALDEEQMRQRKWQTIETNAAMLDITQSPMRRGASRDERLGEAVRLVREGCNVGQACKAVRLPISAEKTIARRCDQRGVPRKRSPALQVWGTHIPDPVIVPPRK
jgi:hypothetical protein